VVGHKPSGSSQVDQRGSEDDKTLLFPSSLLTSPHKGANLEPLQLKHQFTTWLLPIYFAVPRLCCLVVKVSTSELMTSRLQVANKIEEKPEPHDERWVEENYPQSTGEVDDDLLVPCPPHTTERKLVSKIDWHVLPYLCIMYLLAFLDR
jgi:hypothetical protein